MTDFYAMQDPTTQYPTPEFDQDAVPGAGLTDQMDPKPDHGEESYRGTGRLAGRKALVTGGDSGIGRAAAIAFAREGADVAIVHLPQEQSDADEVVALVEKEGRKALSIAGDVKDEEFCRGAVRQALSAFDGLDILVNNAGKQQSRQDVREITTEQLDDTYRTNVYALFWFTQEALPHLPAGASIINTTSVQAYTPSPTLVDYAGTKAAINATTKALAGQLAPKGIRVNAVAPGPVWTPLQPAGGQPPEALPSLGGDTPTGRPGQPVEFCGVFVHLASQESSYTTGATVAVTGGMPTP